MQTSINDTELAQFRSFVIGSEILHTAVNLTSAEILALYTTPKELVATPGTRYVHEFLSAVLILNHGGTDYAGNGNLTIRETDGSGTAVSDTVAEGDFLFGAADLMRVVQVLSADVALAPGSPLVLACATGNPTTGNGTVRVKLAYRTHATGF